MFMDIIKSINWVDLLMLALLIRLVYVAINSGFIVELFKLLGLVVTLFLCFHYYVRLAGFLPKNQIPDNVVFTVVFVLMWFLLALAFKFLRDGVLTLFSIETASAVDKWGAAILGILRFFVVGSMVMFILMSSGMKYLQTKTVDSWSGKYIVRVAPVIYQSIYESFVSRVFQGQHENTVVRETVKDVSK